MKGSFRAADKRIQDALNDPKTWGDYLAYRANGEWFTKKYKGLKSRHAGKIVVVFGKKVVCSSSKTEEIRKCLVELPSLNQAYVRRIPRETEILLM